MAKAANKKTPSKPVTKKATTKRSSKKTKMDRLKDVALSPEMLAAAGIAATGAAVASSPKARRALREAGSDVADAASSGANQLKNNAARISALIGEAVADAVLRVLSGELTGDDAVSRKRKSSGSAGKSGRKS